MAENNAVTEPLDENTRRYYLQVMGIQSWQLLAAEKPGGEQAPVAGINDSDLPGKTGWPQLETAVSQCQQCGLHKSRKQAICGRGSQSAAMMIILLAPQQADDAAGELCSAAQGELLAKMLNAIDISIDNVYITSLLKCAVPARHTVSTGELQRCADYLQQQIQLVQPGHLVVLGETAARCLLQKDEDLDNLRAMINTAKPPVFYESAPLLVSYSPAELLQQPQNKRKAWQDLQQLQQLMHGL